MTDRGPREAQVHLNVHAEEKENWKEAVIDDPNVETLSQLVRLSVTQYIRSSEEDQHPAALEEEIESLSSHNETMERRLQEIRGQLEEIYDTLDSHDVSPETEKLAADIFEELPTRANLQTEPVMKDSNAYARGSITWLTDRMDAQGYQIRAALDYLEQTTHTVGQTEEGQYFKEV